MVLALRIFAIVRNCGLFPRLKEGIAQRIPKARERETYKQTIYLNWSDWALNQSVWWVIMTKLGVNTALYEQSQPVISSERELFTHQKSQMVFTRVQLQISLINLLCVQNVSSWDWRTSRLHLDMPTVSCLTKSPSSIQTVFATCCFL